MKKILVRLFLALVVLAIIAVVAAHFFLDGALKRQVETYGPRLTKVEVKLDAVNLFLLSGSGTIKGLLVGNPEGFKSPSAISVGTASIALEPRSVLSDKIVVRSINVQAPEVTYELGLQGDNLHKILANIEETTGSGQKEPAAPAETKAAKRLEVDDFLIRGGRVRVSVPALGKSGSVALPEIRLKNLGTNPEGITAAELSKQVLQALIEEASKQAAVVVADLTKGAAYLGKDLDLTSTNAPEKVTKTIGDLFKKKK